MTTVTLVAELEAQGIRLKAKHGIRLRIVGRPDRITPTVIEAVRANKEDILAQLCPIDYGRVLLRDALRRIEELSERVTPEKRMEIGDLLAESAPEIGTALLRADLFSLRRELAEMESRARAITDENANS